MKNSDYSKQGYKPKSDVYVIKKDTSKEKFNINKVISAIRKSAYRAIINLSEEEEKLVCKLVIQKVNQLNKEMIPVQDIHNIVEYALEIVNSVVAKSYRDYRNYKIEFVHMLDDIYQKAQAIMYLGDKENSNSDSAMVSTKRSLIFNQFNKELYQKFFMTSEEIQACRDGYVYVHDMSARRDTMNCCLFDVAKVLKGGFEMGNIWYNEPKTVDVAFDVIGDIVLAAASQQYGGFTIPEVDSILKPYAQKTYDITYNKVLKMFLDNVEGANEEQFKEVAHKEAIEQVRREMEQGFQGWEYKFNTVASSRGDYPFITATFGNDCSLFGRMATELILKVRMKGQGKKENKKPVLFPKLVFLYDERIYGEKQNISVIKKHGFEKDTKLTNPEIKKIFQDIRSLAVECSSVAMYPDWLSLTGKGYVASIYKKYGKIISPMGCRAFLSPWYKEGGMKPAHVKDEPVFVGRFNIGAISLNLPMILAKARKENKDFYEVLDYYLEMIRNLHCRTYDYLGEMRASCNPLAYCQGGFLGGNLEFHQKLKESPTLLPSATASFGITALNELQMLYNGKSIREDNKFALEVSAYILDKINKFKEEDNHLYAIYGTPAENLCGLQVKQFRAKYGIVKGVSDRPYVSNSFHCHVSEDMSPIEKQDKESQFWDYFNGGKIQYVKYPIDYNYEAIWTLIKRAMDFGLYEGVNLSLAYCENCGHQEIAMDKCPKCGSKDLTKIERMNGYLSYSRVHGDTRLNDAKMAEIADRKSM